MSVVDELEQELRLVTVLGQFPTLLSLYDGLSLTRDAVPPIGILRVELYGPDIERMRGEIRALVAVYLHELDNSDAPLE